MDAGALKQLGPVVLVLGAGFAFLKDQSREQGMQPRHLCSVLACLVMIFRVDGTGQQRRCFDFRPVWGPKVCNDTRRHDSYLSESKECRITKNSKRKDLHIC